MSGNLKFILLLILILSGFVGLVYLCVRMLMPGKKKDTNRDILMLILILSGFVGLVLLGIIAGRALLMTVIGPCVVFCAFMDYDWFMNSYKAAPLRALLVRDGTRVLYIFFGIVIFFVGLLSI